MPVTPLLHNPDPANIPPPPRSLDDLPFWGVWKRENGTKVPYNPLTGRRAKPNDPRTFGTRDQAESALATGRYAGLCILIDESLGITGGDLDHIVAEGHAFDESKIPPAVWRLIRIANTWTCWSPSGTGIRFIFGASLGRRYMTKNKSNRICAAEAYSRLRFMTVKLDRRITGTPDTFNTDADDLEAWHEALGFPLRGAEQPPRPQPTYAGGTHSNEEIIEAASRVSGDKFRRLHAGDISGYPESQTDKGFSSEADGALALILCGYTSDDHQVADIMRSSGLYRKKYDRADYLVDRTITSARKIQRWWFDWNANGQFTAPPPNDHDGYSVPPAAPTPSTGTTCDAQLADALSTIARQADIIKQQRETLQGIERILANDQIQIGPRVTGIALLLELNSQKQRGKKPKEHGHHIPAVWLARRTGSTAKTANSHVKKLEKMDLIQRKVVSEVVSEDEVVDKESGEIFTVGEVRKRAYYPADQAKAIITNLAHYRRKDEDTKHGGKRITACNEHPDAGTIKRWTLECAECHKPLDSGEDHRKPDGLQDNPAPTTQDGSSTARDDQAAPNITRIPNLGHRSPTVVRDIPKMGQREIPGIPEEPPGFWAGPPPAEPEPWLWEGVGS